MQLDCAKFRSRSHNAVIRVYDAAANVIGTHNCADDFKDVEFFRFAQRRGSPYNNNYGYRRIF